MLARNLLTEDGVIFISIDDNEQSNLKKICDEIFGEGNAIGLFVKQSKVGGGSDSKFIVKEHEYCFVYTKNFDKASEFYIAHEDDYLSRYKEQDKNGKYFWDTLARPGLKNPIVYSVDLPDGTKVKNGWIWSEERFIQAKKSEQIKFSKKTDGSWSVQFKQYLNLNGKKPRSMTMDFGGNIDGKGDFENLFDGSKLFDYPKSVNYVLRLISLAKVHSSTVLDFFSGSGTTAHAVMKLNAEDGGNRKFIMVQLPEKTEEDSEAYKAGYKNICEIGKERIRRAGEKVKQEMLEKDASADVSKLDVGFKVFKLDSTNIKPWDGTQDINQMLIEASGNVVKTDRTDLDVVHELMLMYGVFNEEVEEIKINGKTLYSIGEHFLVVCLFKSITKQDIEAIIKLKPKNVIFNDAGFENDNVKINAELTLKNQGVEDIKSL
jgi:adenine-specific DNA-methyltransferase